MLAVSGYDKKYVDQCEARMTAQLAAYQSLVVAARTPVMLSALAQFEPPFLNNLTLALDGCFAHRTRAVEGKDGNALNEVRMLCTSILKHKGVLTADSTIKYKPEAVGVEAAHRRSDPDRMRRSSAPWPRRSLPRSGAASGRRRSRKPGRGGIVRGMVVPRGRRALALARGRRRPAQVFWLASVPLPPDTGAGPSDAPQVVADAGPDGIAQPPPADARPPAEVGTFQLPRTPADPRLTRKIDRWRGRTGRR